MFNSYSAAFEGNGRTISNLYINRPDAGSIGLFGSTSGAGAIRKVGLEGASVTGQNQVGALVGLANGPVEYSYSTGSINGTSTVGGLVGYSGNHGDTTDSYATGKVSGQSEIGGLVGLLLAQVKTSYATAKVTASGSVAGGLVGSNSRTSTIQAAMPPGEFPLPPPQAGWREAGAWVQTRSPSATGTLSQRARHPATAAPAATARLPTSWRHPKATPASTSTGTWTERLPRRGRTVGLRQGQALPRAERGLQRRRDAPAEPFRAAAASMGMQ